MRLISRAGLALLLAAAATPLAAQDYSSAVGWYAGAMHATTMNSGGTGTSIAPKWGWTAGVFYENWLGSGRVGYRMNAGLGRQNIPWNGADRNINTWLGDFDLVLRLLPAGPDQSFNMFVLGGPGAVVYDFGTGLPVTDQTAGAVYGGRQDFRFAPTFGGGFDIRTPWSADFSDIWIRLQADDHMVLKSPFSPVSGADFGAIHQLRFTIGLHAGIGTLHGGEALRRAP